MSDSSDENVSSSSRRRRSGNQIPHSSDDSDGEQPRKKPNKRKKQNVLETASSESESSSDNSIALNANRRKRKMPRVESEESSSNSSSSGEESEEELVTRRRVRIPVPLESENSDVESSDSEDASSESGVSAGESESSLDSSYSAEEEAMVQAAIEQSLMETGQQSRAQNKEDKKEAAASLAAGFTSDSSDGQSEKCPICLISFTDQEVGSPETCDHVFCAVCIQEWAKNVNTCPVDRQVFSLVLIRKHLNGKVIKRIPIENRDGRDLGEEPDPDPTFCEVCGQSDREDRLLLCDGCDVGYHLDCLDPPLQTVPVEEWFCPDCSDNTRLAEAVDIQEGELHDLLDDEVEVRPRVSRLLPRTRQSERVRATIRTLHRQLVGEISALQPTTSGIESVGADSGSVTSGRQATSTVRASSTVRRRKVVRRKTVKKRRKRRVARRKPVKRKVKVTKKTDGVEGTDEEGEEEEEDNYTRKTKRRKRRKRKIKRKKKKVARRKTARTAGRRAVVPRSVKGRLAEQLGMCAPNRAGVSLPVVRPRASIPDIDTQRSRAGIPTLHIFGQQNQLDYFSSDNEEGNAEEGGVAVGVRPRLLHSGSSRLLARKRVLSAAALQSHTAVTSPRPVRSKLQQASAPIDLVGSILDSQKIWHSKTPAVTIGRDGSLQVKRDLEKTSDAPVSSGQGNVCNGSLDKDNGGLIRSGKGLSDITPNNSPIDLSSTSTRTTQAPMYPGQGGGGSERPPPSAGFHQFGGNRYSAPAYQSSYQGGRGGFSAFSPSGSNFDANSTREGYSNYLNSGLPPPLLRQSPVRFRVTPRYPVRRSGQQRQHTNSPHRDDKKLEDNGEGSQKLEEEDEEGEEEDEIDIYSDIEAGGGGSGGPSGGGSEPEEGERIMETSYEALPPPPEPSALLMGFGEQALSEEDANSDSELVIDDNGPPSPHEAPEAADQIPESDKYDPAEPSRDSDEESSCPSPSKAVPKEDIPLPPGPPAGGPLPLLVNVTPHIVNSSSNSNASYLRSPTYGGSPAYEGKKISSVAADGVVSSVVKEVIKEHLSGSSGLRNVDMRSSPTGGHSPVDKIEEDDCPNFSIYSAASMDIARRNTEAEGDIVIVEPDTDKTIEKPQIHPIHEAESDKKEEKMEADDSESDEPLKDGDQSGDLSGDQSGQSDQSGDQSVSSSEKSDKSDKPDEMEVKDDSADSGDDSDSESSSDDEDSKSTGDTNDTPLPSEGSEKDSSRKEPPFEVCGEPEHSEAIDVDENAKADVPHTDSVAEKGEDKTKEDKSEDKNEASKEDAFDSDDDSLIGGATSAISAVTIDNINPPTSATPLGLEGLETETISETEEAINFDDLSQDENIMSGEEDGEISSGKKKKRRRDRGLDHDGKELSDLSGELNVEKERTPPEEGEIIDDRPKIHDAGKREKKSVEKKEPAKEPSKVVDENFDVSKQKDEEKKKKKKEKKSSEKKDSERSVLSSSENKRKSKEKGGSRRSEEANISWKKPSKNTKERNYRDTKISKPDELPKEREEKEDDGKDAGKKKKKEKRKDMERYDVRKIVSDKRRRRKDEFGRDLSRDRTFSRSRSRSRERDRRSRDRSRSRSRNRSRHRSPLRSRRSRSRSRYRSRSRSYRRTRSKSKTRSKRKSKERLRRSRSKDRSRLRLSRSRSRGRRSRTRSRSHSRSKKGRRSRSRSLVKQRRDRNDRSHGMRDTSRPYARRSWSRTWTPSWSRSRSQSISCSSFTHRSSASVGRFNRSFSRSFSRSWSRERYERIPLEKTGAISNKAPKKLTVIVSNTKDTSDRQKKEKKKKKDRKNKEAIGTAEKRKKRKEKSPAPSKEVFTSGDNILVSINFNKSSKPPTSKEASASVLPALPKDTMKRKREETFEGEREVVGKKVRKEKGKDKNKGAAGEKGVVGPQEGQKKKKLVPKGKSARMAALMKQKPVAIIDLDQSPFREQTPSPRDLIVLSDSDDDARNKQVEREEIVESLGVRRVLRPEIASPQSPAKGVHSVPAGISGTRTPESQLPLMSAVSNYLNTSTGPKTPPEPQVKFSIASKAPQLRSINNPLQEEEEDDMPEDGGLDDSDQRIQEEVDRSLGEIVHKGPNTPPEPRGPTTPCSPPTSPDVYDPFDPTKSATPSPRHPEASMDGPPSPPQTPVDEIERGTVGESGGRDSPLPSDLEDMVNKNGEARGNSPSMQPNEEVAEESLKSPDRGKTVPRVGSKSPVGMSDSMSMPTQLQNEELPQVAEISEGPKTTHCLPSSITSVTVSESSIKSPERKIGVVITSQPKLQTTPLKQPVFPVPALKQIPVSQQGMTSTPSHSSAPTPMFPALTPVNIANMLCTPPANLGLGRTPIFTPPAPLSMPSLLQHVSTAATPVQARMPSDARPTPAPPLPLRSLIQNGEQPKQPQDTTTEVIDMDLDSPYSPGSSEGDDLFDPPADTPSRDNQATGRAAERSKAAPQAGKGVGKLALPLPILPTHKSPNKSTQDKFDSLFGKPGGPISAPSGPAAPAKGNRKGHKGAKTKTKHVKGGRKEIAIKMDEDQLQILDELPSSAVELQVKDKFLKKLNRQERVVEEVKLSLKPHYNRKHITKDEYKDILRKSVPKICHNKSGEINPVKIASLVEAYVKKVRYEKKKNANSSSGNNPTPAKAKAAKTTKWS